MVQRFKNYPIRIKILAAFTVVLSLISFFVSIYFPQQQNQQVTNALKYKAESISQILAEGVSSALDQGDYDFINRLFMLIKSDSSILYIAICDESGNPIISYNPQQIQIPTKEMYTYKNTVEEEDILHNAIPLQIEEDVQGALVMGFSLQERNRAFTQIRKTSTAISATIFILGILLFSYLSQLITKPINRLVDIINDFDVEGYQNLIEKSSTDEVGNLIDAFNGMIAKLQLRTAEREQADEQIKASLKDKEVLLQEIHHRVKNNLQIISSLLDLQLSHIKDEQARVAIQDSRTCVMSMALIHEKLYQTEDLALVDFGEYIHALAAQIFDSYNAGEKMIELRINADSVYLDTDKAIPCGLILNELVTNSLKYAFPSGQGGEIRIDLHARSNEVGLSVSDNGVGFPKDVDLHQVGSLGMKLIGILTTQLHGTIEHLEGEGTTFEITFSLAEG